MATTKLTVPSVEELRAQYCEDVRRLKVRAGVTRPNVAPGSETYIRGEAVASVAAQIMAREVALAEAQMPDSGIGDDLTKTALRWCGLTRSTGAGAQGYVLADCTGVVVYPSGLEGRSVDGLRYQVITTTIATNGSQVPIRGIDVGTRTDKPYNTVITWTSPPAGSAVSAPVDTAGLTNGADADTDAKLRQRLQDQIRHPPNSGNWADFASWAEKASAAVEKAFVYPAANGPSTVRVAYTVAGTEDNYWIRSGTAALTATVALGVVAKSPEHCDVTTTSVSREYTQVILRATLPDTVVDGGKGGGWIDPIATRWPGYIASGGYYGAYLSTAPLTPTKLRVDCVHATNAPDTTGTDHPFIAIWSTAARKFLHAQVKLATLVAGTVYDIDLYEPVQTALLSADDQVCPDAEHIDDYGVTMAQSFTALGPGEITTDANLLPRSLRHPLQHESWKSNFTSTEIGQLGINHPEIQHVDVVVPTHMPAAPSVAVTVNSAPRILCLGSFGLYPT